MRMKWLQEWEQKAKKEKRSNKRSEVNLNDESRPGGYKVPPSRNDLGLLRPRVETTRSRNESERSAERTRINFRERYPVPPPKSNGVYTKSLLVVLIFLDLGTHTLKILFKMAARSPKQPTKACGISPEPGVFCEQRVCSCTPSDTT